MTDDVNRERFPLLAFRPVFKRIRWGGRRLQTLLGKPLGDGGDYAESWEVSTHPDGLSVVDGGPHDGRTLAELVRSHPEELLGLHRRADDFPLLCKFLDAHDRLSVQVHPDDARAQQSQPGENGKTEAWVILDAEPHSRLFTGLNSGVDRESLSAAIKAGSVEDCLHDYAVSPGDCVFMPAGTVHAIGEGILLAEVQQSSNLTYRLYDWGRVGTDGSPRELHVEEALGCIDFTRGPVDPVTPEVISERDPRTERLVDCPQFSIRRHTSSAPFEIVTGNAFRVLMTLAGEADVSASDDCRHVRCGDTLLAPASCPPVRVEPCGRDALVLLEAGPGETDADL